MDFHTDGLVRLTWAPSIIGAVGFERSGCNLLLCKIVVHMSSLTPWSTAHIFNDFIYQEKSWPSIQQSNQFGSVSRWAPHCSPHECCHETILKRDFFLQKKRENLELRCGSFFQERPSFHLMPLIRVENPKGPLGPTSDKSSSFRAVAEASKLLTSTNNRN